MNRKQITIILVVLLVVVVLVVVGLTTNNGDVGDEAIPEGGTETFNPEVPDENLELTKPEVETEAAPGVEARLRIFNMSASRDGFEPEQIVVNEGDTISIRLNGGDNGFDVALPDLGLHQSVDEGEERKLEFQALTPGTFTYLCQDMCPGGEIKGSLVVKKR